MPVSTALHGLLVALLLPLLPPRQGAEDTPAKRLSAVVAVAIDEYAKGVDAGGKIISAVELDEATAFLRYAKDVAKRLTLPNADAVRLLLDSLGAAADRRAAPGELVLLNHKFVVALGVEGALDYPTHALDLTRGKALFEQHCMACHGVRGAGDGPQARDIRPPPLPIGTSKAMYAVTPALTYRIISVGVQGTQMVGWGSQLTPDEREKVPQPLRVWLRYRSEKYFGPGRTPPGG